MKEKVTDRIFVLLALVSFILSIHSNGRAGTPVDGAALYAAHCSRCHGALLPKIKVSTAQIVKAISTVSAMRPLYDLPTAELQAIAMAASAGASSSSSEVGRKRRSKADLSSAGGDGQLPACYGKGS